MRQDSSHTQLRTFSHSFPHLNNKISFLTFSLSYSSLLCGAVSVTNLRQSGNMEISSGSLRSYSNPATVTESRGVCHGVSGERVHDTGVLHFTEITDIVVVSSGVWPILTHLGSPDQSPVRDCRQLQLERVTLTNSLQN